MSLKYVYEKTKTAIGIAIGRKMTLCYVRVRCPCCGMWTRLDNLKREQPLYEECTTYSGGRAMLVHDKKTNPSLKEFWIIHLKRILKRLGVEAIEKPYSLEVALPYQYGYGRVNYGVEKGVNYGYER